jgi:hypothetical protein
MSRQFWSEGLWWAVADGSSIANTTTETVIFPNVTIPANYFSDARVLRLTAAGRLSTTGTPTVRFRLRWGGVSGTVFWDSGTITCGSGVTASEWRHQIEIICRSNGSAGSLFAMGQAMVGSALAPTVGSATGAAATGVYGSAGDDTPAAVTLDLSADTALSISAEWGTANASNTLTGHMYLGESLN